MYPAIVSWVATLDIVVDGDGGADGERYGAI